MDEDDCVGEQEDAAPMAWIVVLEEVDEGFAIFGDTNPDNIRVNMSKDYWIEQNRPGQLKVILPHAKEMDYN